MKIPFLLPIAILRFLVYTGIPKLNYTMQTQFNQLQFVMELNVRNYAFSRKW